LVDRLGVVLAGGRSSRFGSDKFLHVVNAMEMGLRAIHTLQPIVDRVVVAGRRELPSSWDAEPIYGQREGSGPLGAIIDSAEEVDSHLLVIVPCDMPNLTSSSVSKLIDAMTAPNLVAAFAHSSTLEEPQWLTACWRTDAVRERVAASYAEGVRSVREVARGVNHVLVDLPPEDLINLNSVVTS